MLTNASLSGLSVLASLLPLHQILIYRTHDLPQLRYFWNTFRWELVNKFSYKASIGSMRLRLQELQETNSEAQKLGTKDGYQEVNRVFYNQGPLFVPKVIWTELINHHHNNPLASHFSIEKICKLLAQKYYYLTLRHNVKAYVKGCNVFLASKELPHKVYSDL